MARPIIIVMAKAPRAGNVKTRLVPPLSIAAAASLASCFLQDTILNARRVVKEVLVAYTPIDGHKILEPILPEGLLWAEQLGEDLGERLENTISYAAGLGYSPLIVVGTDSPTVPVSFLLEALDSLSTAKIDVALGPTDDGGYYLVGVRQFRSGLFHGVEWSTPLAYLHTARNAARMGLRTMKLPGWYDVDTFADLLRLRDELFSNETEHELTLATYRWLKVHDSLLLRLQVRLHA